jgi:hypothetical protein
MSFRVVAASGGIRRGCVRASGAVTCVHPRRLRACIRRRCLRASGDYPSTGSGRGTPGRRVRGCPGGPIVGYSSSRWTRFRRHRIGFPPIPRCQGGTCSPQPVPPLLFPGVRPERRLLVGLRRVPRSAQGRRSRGQTGPCSCMHSACSCVAGATHGPAGGSGGGGLPRLRRCRIIDRGTAFRFGGQTGPLVGHADVVHRSGDCFSGRWRAPYRRRHAPAPCSSSSPRVRVGVRRVAVSRLGAFRVDTACVLGTGADACSVGPLPARGRAADSSQGRRGRRVRGTRRPGGGCHRDGRPGARRRGDVGRPRDRARSRPAATDRSASPRARDPARRARRSPRRRVETNFLTDF